jgi:hypothetical protein
MSGAKELRRVKATHKKLGGGDVRQLLFDKARSLADIKRNGGQGAQGGLVKREARSRQKASRRLQQKAHLRQVGKDAPQSPSGLQSASSRPQHLLRVSA